MLILEELQEHIFMRLRGPGKIMQYHKKHKNLSDNVFRIVGQVFCRISLTN